MTEFFRPELIKIFNAIIQAILHFRAWVEGWLAPAMPIVKSASIVISAILIWGIFYAATRSGYFIRRIEDFKDKYMVGNVGKDRQMRAWRRILKRMRSDSPESWKRAILDADDILDEILKMSGYVGNTPDERFQQLPPEALANHDRIIAAHKIRDQIQRNPEYTLDRSEAIAVLREYEKAFKQLGLIA